MRNEQGLVLRIAAPSHRAMRASASLAFSILVSVSGLMRRMQPLAQGFRQMYVSRLHFRHAASDHVTLDQVKRQGDGAGDSQGHQQYEPGALDAAEDYEYGAAEGIPHADQHQRPRRATEQCQRAEPA